MHAKVLKSCSVQVAEGGIAADQFVSAYLIAAGVPGKAVFLLLLFRLHRTHAPREFDYRRILLQTSCGSNRSAYCSYYTVPLGVSSLTPAAVFGGLSRAAMGADESKPEQADSLHCMETPWMMGCTPDRALCCRGPGKVGALRAILSPLRALSYSEGPYIHIYP